MTITGAIPYYWLEAYLNFRGGEALPITLVCALAQARKTTEWPVRMLEAFGVDAKKLRDIVDCAARRGGPDEMANEAKAVVRNGAILVSAEKLVTRLRAIDEDLQARSDAPGVAIYEAWRTAAENARNAHSGQSWKRPERPKDAPFILADALRAVEERDAKGEAA